MLLEKQKGNYLVIGGDFNNELAQSYKIVVPYNRGIKSEESWVQELPETFVTFVKNNGFKMTFAVNEATCRSTAYSYVINESRVWTIDGFILSEEINVKTVGVVQGTDLSVSGYLHGYSNFIYSDHNPVYLEISFN